MSRPITVAALKFSIIHAGVKLNLLLHPKLAHTKSYDVINAELQAGKLRLLSFKVIGVTQIESKPESTAPGADAPTALPSELLI